MSEYSIEVIIYDDGISCTVCQTTLQQQYELVVIR